MQPFYGLTPKLVGGLVVVLLLVLAIPVSLKLTQQYQSTSSKASKEAEPVAGTSIELSQHIFNCQTGDPANGIKAGTDCNKVTTDKTIAVDVLIHSDIDPANLVKADLSFDPNYLTVEKLVTKSNTPTTQSGTAAKKAGEFFVSLWVNSGFKNDTGTIQLVGSVPNPGFITSEDAPGTLARIYLKPKKPGTTEIKINEKSAIYRNADNQNILSKTKNLNLTIND